MKLKRALAQMRCEKGDREGNLRRTEVHGDALLVYELDVPE
ncbi:MAG TPA: hypothetical protein VND68_03235 [Chloroflexia bacterium]|jgi:hypothetical protein|nr:hypothetical protein [Chloroflexia bacterium]